MPPVCITSISRSRAGRYAASLALLSMLAACGYKGPLYLPPPPPPDEALTTPPTPVNLPAAEAPAPPSTNTTQSQ